MPIFIFISGPCFPRYRRGLAVLCMNTFDFLNVKLQLRRATEAVVITSIDELAPLILSYCLL